MRLRIVSVALAAAALCAATGCALWQGWASGERAVIIPAESGELAPPMQVGTREGLEGGKYIFTDTGHKGLARYTVRVPRGGRYYLFAHAFGPDSTTDSFFVEFDREPDRTDPHTVWDVARAPGFWQPVLGRVDGERRPRSWQLTAGDHVLFVAGREHKARLDVLALTTDPEPRLPAFGPPADLGKYARRRPPELDSRVPLIYHIGYSDAYFTTPAYLEAFRPAPPDLLHIGKAAPITHNWGPVPMLFGENQATGGPGHTLNWDNIRLLSPNELREKIRLITRTVRRAHKLGIRYVCPYIGQRCLAGDPDTRKGFWNFYDHWDTYAEWLGPKPPTDPSEWLYRGRDGKPRPVYGPTFDVPYFAPLKRYGACPNNPHWLRFQKAVVRLIAQCGYDGVFIDNMVNGGDTCPHCWARLQQFLAARPRDELERRYGVADPAALKSWADVPARLHSRFRLECLRDYGLALRDHARQTHPRFFLFANNYTMSHCFVLGESCRLIMWENAFPSGLTIDGEPPATDTTAVEVVAQPVAEPPRAYPQDFLHPETFTELKVETRLPARCTAGKPVPLAVKIVTVGNSNADDDAIEDVALLLRRQGSGKATRVELLPRGRIGGVVPGVVHKPPIELRGTWTPPEPGSYVAALEYRYTDTPHIGTTNRLLVTDRVRPAGCVWQTHIGGYSLAACGKARVVPHGRGTNPELALAECAAFGGGASASVRRGWARVRYQRFFRAHPDLYDGMEPCAAVALLGAYWGGNPYHNLRVVWPNAADHLSACHVLFKSLLDTSLTPAHLHGVEAIVCIASDYEMTADAVAALKQLVARGGRLLLMHQGTTVNGEAIEAVLGKHAVTMWQWDAPPKLAEPISPARGRARGLRFACTRDAGGRRLVLHAVNYNVGITRKSTTPLTPLADIAVRLPLPQGFRPRRVVAYDPDRPDERLALPFTTAGGRLVFAIPRVRIYRLIEIH